MNNIKDLMIEYIIKCNKKYKIYELGSDEFATITLGCAKDKFILKLYNLFTRLDEEKRIRKYIVRNEPNWFKKF